MRSLQHPSFAVLCRRGSARRNLSRALLSVRFYRGLLLEFLSGLSLHGTLHVFLVDMDLPTSRHDQPVVWIYKRSRHEHLNFRLGPDCLYRQSARNTVVGRSEYRYGLWTLLLDHRPRSLFYEHVVFWVHADFQQNGLRQYRPGVQCQPDTHARGTFDEAAYREYSPLFLSTTFLLSYGLSFAGITATIVHTVLYFRRQIWTYTRRSLNEQEDIHARLMSKYKQVPAWWYLATFGEYIHGS